MTHIKYMLYTCAPAYVISAVLYTILGIRHGSSSYDPTAVNEIITNLSGIFKLGFIPLIPVIVVIYMLIRKKDTILTLLIGAVVAAVIAIVYQGFSIKAVGGFAYSGFVVDSDNAILKSLLNRGGMSSMFSMVAIFIGALGLGGIISGMHLLEPVIEAISKRVKSGKSLMLITAGVVILCILLVSTNHFAFAMVGLSLIHISEPTRP